MWYLTYLIEAAIDALVAVHDQGRVNVLVVDYYVHQGLESHSRPAVLQAAIPGPRRRFQDMGDNKEFW